MSCAVFLSFSLSCDYVYHECHDPYLHLYPRVRKWCFETRLVCFVLCILLTGRTRSIIPAIQYCHKIRVHNTPATSAEHCHLLLRPPRTTPGHQASHAVQWPTCLPAYLTTKRSIATKGKTAAPPCVCVWFDLSIDQTNK